MKIYIWGKKLVTNHQRHRTVYNKHKTERWMMKIYIWDKKLVTNHQRHRIVSNKHKRERWMTKIYIYNCSQCQCMWYAHPIAVASSAWLQIKFGAITMAIFWGVILFTSWLRDSSAKNFMRYRKLSKFACGNLLTTTLSACRRASLDDWILQMKCTFLYSTTYYRQGSCIKQKDLRHLKTWWLTLLPSNTCGNSLKALTR